MFHSLLDPSGYQQAPHEQAQQYHMLPAPVPPPPSTPAAPRRPRKQKQLTPSTVGRITDWAGAVPIPAAPALAQQQQQRQQDPVAEFVSMGPVAGSPGGTARARKVSFGEPIVAQLKSAMKRATTTKQPQQPQLQPQRPSTPTSNKPPGRPRAQPRAQSDPFEAELENGAGDGARIMELDDVVEPWEPVGSAGTAKKMYGGWHPK